MTKIFVPQLDASEVAPIFKAHRWRKPKSITGRTVARWHHGIYYQYGNKTSWFPLNSMGGIATKAFHSLTVTFPPSVESELLALLDEKKRQSKCRHDWATHQDSDPTAAGVIIEGWRQCTKCGQIREPALIH